MQFALGDYRKESESLHVFASGATWMTIGFQIHCYFALDNDKDLSTVRVDTLLGVLGKIRHMDKSKIVLDECDILVNAA